MGQDGGRPLDPATDYIRELNAFFSGADMTATYKPVFLRWLLDLGKYDVHGSNCRLPGSEWIAVDGDTVTLDLNFVAARFLKYYWDMDDSFHLRQTSNRGDAVIVQIVREGRSARESADPPTLEELVSASGKGLRQKTLTRVIKRQALEYLQEDMKSLYAWERGSDEIALCADTIPFFRRHRETILNGLNPKLSDHLAKLNKAIPHSSAKPGEEAHTLYMLHPEATWFIDEEQRQRCFYCDRPHGEKRIPHIDRVIPDIYAFSADMHNCVVACIGCGLQKRSRLPAAEHFMGVLDRNDGIERRLARLPASVRGEFAGYDGVWYRKTYTSYLGRRRNNVQLFSP